jgi:cytochrome c5
MSYYSLKMYFLVSLFFLCQCTVVTEIIAMEAVVNKNKPLLVDTKCSKCHTINRVFIHARTEEEWHTVIEKMMAKTPDWISPVDAKKILIEINTNWHEHVQEMTAERKGYADNRLLFLDRCTMCHPVNRILKGNRPSEEWNETVERMRSEAGEYITEEDVSRIAAFLSERSEVLKEDAGSELFVTKCLVCHPPEEKVLLARHTKVEWEEIVKDRRQFARNATPRIRIGTEDAAVIVELLTKTQGPEQDRSSP